MKDAIVDAILLTSAHRLDLFTRREPVARYRYAPELPPGFEFLNAFDARSVTAPDEASGQALWIGHGSVNDVAFGLGRNPESGDKESVGKIVSLGLTARRGLLSVGFQEECAWVASDGTVLLRDQRTVRLTPGPSEGSIFDLTLRLTAPSSHSITLGRMDKSLLRLCFASALLPSGGGQLRNSADDYGPDEMHGRSAAWCAGVGVVRGETVGMALLDHPDNRWHPPRWTVSEAGLVAPQPFSWSAMELDPGETLRLRYRIYTHQGYIDAGWCNARLAEFAIEPLRS